MRRGRPRKAKDAPSKGGFQYVSETLDIWKPSQEGDTLVGLVVSVRPGKFGRMVTVQDEQGIKWTLPAHKVLDSRLEAVPDPPGLRPGHTVLEITYTESKRTRKGGSETQFYKVGYRELQEEDAF